MVTLGGGLKLSTADSRRVAWLVAHYQSLVVAHTLPWPRLQRLLVADGNQELLALAAAVVQATGAESAGVEHCRRQLRLPPDELDPPPLITGDDLRRHGIPPGPEYQRLLEEVRDAQLEKSISTKSRALALVDKLRRIEGPDRPSANASLPRVRLALFNPSDRPQAAVPALGLAHRSIGHQPPGFIFGHAMLGVLPRKQVIL